jgi:hypothetical protein
VYSKNTLKIYLKYTINSEDTKKYYFIFNVCFNIKGMTSPRPRLGATWLSLKPNISATYRLPNPWLGAP